MAGRPGAKRRAYRPPITTEPGLATVRYKSVGAGETLETIARHLGAMRERPFIAVYMMSNRRHGTIYTGVSSDLPERVRQHREGLIKGFTKKYGLKRLVWFEPHHDMIAAIQREKSLKKYKREWKVNLIERENLYWIDLYPMLVSGTEGMGGRDALRFAPGRPAMTDL